MYDNQLYEKKNNRKEGQVDPFKRKYTWKDSNGWNLTGGGILPYDDRAAEWHAKERARLSSSGLTPSFVDGQIASIAKVNDLILVTRNTDDFKPFSKLKLENWHNP